jgi:hypothetical protein
MLYFAAVCIHSITLNDLHMEKKCGPIFPSNIYIYLNVKAGFDMKESEWFSSSCFVNIGYP